MTPPVLIGHMAVGLCAGVILVSLGEYLIHRYVMHGAVFSALLSFCPGPFQDIWLDHAVKHHRRFYRRFDHEPDPVGREIGISISWWHTAAAAVGMAPALALLAWGVSPVAAAAALCVVPIQTLAWNALHREMHQPNGGWWTRSGIYRFLEAYHRAHHDRPETNFHITLPLFDVLFGTLSPRRRSRLGEASGGARAGAAGHPRPWR